MNTPRNLTAAISKIKDWVKEDQPKYKLEKSGSSNTTTSELLAVIIGRDCKQGNAVDIAKGVLNLTKNNLIKLSQLSHKNLMEVEGVTKDIALRIIASFEIGRRRQISEADTTMGVRSSREIAMYIQPKIQDLEVEVFGVLYLNRANRIKEMEIISRGGITGTVADPRIILKAAVMNGATSIVLFHNHPSGNLQPSKADEELTQKIKMAASYFDIKVLDHIIVSAGGYFSFADEGII